jgi:hypothetical protein
MLRLQQIGGAGRIALGRWPAASAGTLDNYPSLSARIGRREGVVFGLD